MSYRAVNYSQISFRNVHQLNVRLVQPLKKYFQVQRCNPKFSKTFHTNDLFRLRTWHTFTKLSRFIYSFRTSREESNFFAWNYMKNDHSYVNRTANKSNLDKCSGNWKSNAQKRSKFPAIASFVSLSESHDVAGTKTKPTLESHSALIESVITELKYSSFDEVICCLDMLMRWPPCPVHKGIFFKFWTTLDNKSTELISQLPIDQNLMLADCWFNRRLNTFTQFNSEMVNVLVKERLDVMKTTEFVQMMFYAGLKRQLSSTQCDIIEKKLGRVVEALKIDELGIVAHGFNNTMTAIKSKDLLKRIIVKVSRNMENIDNFSLVYVLKFLKLSSSAHHEGEIRSLIHQLLMSSEKYIKNFNSFCCIHLIVLCSFQNVYDKSIIDQIYQKCSESIENLRLKDISLLICTMVKFNHDSNAKFTSLLIAECRKQINSKLTFKEHLHVLSLVLALSYFKIYDKYLLDYIFSENSINKCMNGEYHFCSRDLYKLHYNLLLEHNEYASNFLPEEIIKDGIFKLNLEINNKKNDNTLHFSMTKSVLHILKSLYHQTEGIIEAKMLPHYEFTDIYASIDSHGNLNSYVKIPNQMEKLPPDQEWVCFLIGSSVRFYTHPNRKPTGHFYAKHQQLKRLGYRVIEVPWYDFWNKSLNERMIFISKQIRSVLKS